MADDFRVVVPAGAVPQDLPALAYDEFLAGAGECDLLLNACGSCGYLESGYFVSLIAEARGWRVLPSVKTLADFNNPGIRADRLAALNREPILGPAPDGELQIDVRAVFGHAVQGDHACIAARAFDQFALPLLHVRLRWEGRWIASEVAALDAATLSEAERRLLRLHLRDGERGPLPARQAAGRARLAMFVNAEEYLPPSDPEALERFTSAASALDMEVERIGPGDISRLGAFDALFMREEPDVADHTYHFMRTAELAGLAVIDDPDSSIRCTNKVFLAELARTHGIATPRTVLLARGDPDPAARVAELGFPLVLKTPQGSYCFGTHKVKNPSELVAVCRDLFAQSALILAQEYVPTAYDWRVGIIDRRALYACQYHMPKGHWQIYRHLAADRADEGEVVVFDLAEVPSAVLALATRAAGLFGDGFYGVDLKEVDGRVIVIEVNDNPSINYGDEDARIGDELYRSVIAALKRRVARLQAQTRPDSAPGEALPILPSGTLL